MRRLLLVTIVCAWTAPALAYSHFGPGVGNTRVHWTDTPVRWLATDRGAPASRRPPSRRRSRAFTTWQEVPTASIEFSFAGFTAAEPFDEEGLSVIGFQAHPEMERVLGATTFLFDDETGELIEADIFFNSIFEWSTAAAGTRIGSILSVAVHEIGHFLGLGHSAIGETEIRPEGGRRVLGSGAVMFPISLGRGSVVDRVLQPDDIAGVSDLYPDDNFENSTGGVRGRAGAPGRPEAHT